MRYRHDPDGTRLPIKLDTDDQRRVRADSAGARASPCAQARARARRRPTRERLGPDAPRLPGVGLRRRDDAARR